uniref:TrmB family transcriptional regulator n=1 Tax=Archaeoglobus fulgidus TaxID=2234 RepID=A0A7C3RLV0_ARCFL
MKSLKEMISSLNCGNLLECVLGLTPADVMVYEALLRGKERVDEISECIGKGESAVYKSLQRLLLSGMAYRVKMPLNGGGYYFIYKPAPKEKVVEEVEKVLTSFVERVRRVLEEFKDDSGSRVPGMWNLQ